MNPGKPVRSQNSVLDPSLKRVERANHEQSRPGLWKPSAGIKCNRVNTVAEVVELPSRRPQVVPIMRGSKPDNILQHQNLRPMLAHTTNRLGKSEESR